MTDRGSSPCVLQASCRQRPDLFASKKYKWEMESRCRSWWGYHANPDAARIDDARASTVCSSVRSVVQIDGILRRVFADGLRLVAHVALQQLLEYIALFD